MASLLTFTLSLSEETSGPVSVHATTSDRTAKAGSDYTARDLTVSFAAGQTSRTVTVPVLGDTVVELPERLAVALSVPNGATLGDSVALGTIGNDDRGLRVLTPNGGERWARGTKHRISWLWGRLSGRITIQLVRSGTVVRQITGKAALGTNGRGHFTWTVPSGITPARGYKIRLVSNKRPAFKDSSDRGFRITRG